jgi:hypothetical protein
VSCLRASKEGPADRDSNSSRLVTKSYDPAYFIWFMRKICCEEEDKLSFKKADGQIGTRPANNRHGRASGKRAHNSNQSSKQLGVIITNGLDAARRKRGRGGWCALHSRSAGIVRRAKRVEEGKSNFQN